MARDTSPWSAERRWPVVKAASLARSCRILVRIAGVLASQRHQPVMREAQLLAQLSQVFLDEARMKPVVARRHWSVGGEDHFARNPRQGLVKSDPRICIRHGGLPARSPPWPSFRGSTPGVTPIALSAENRRLPSNNFLADADTAVSAVQPDGKFVILRGVAFYVGIEEQQVAAPNLNVLTLARTAASARFNLDRDRFAGRIGGTPSALAVCLGALLLSGCQPLRSSRWRKYPCP